MFKLDKPTPLGFGRHNWPLFVIAGAGALRLLSLADVGLSSALQAWPENVRAFFRWITDAGLSEWVLVPSLVLFVLSFALIRPVPDRQTKLALIEMSGLWAFIFLGVGIAGLVANLVKRAIGRGRPHLFDQLGAFDFRYFAHDWQFQSFPSGHAATIFATALVVGFLSNRWFLPTLLLAVLVGLSRVVVGAHYPTDVLGGVLCAVPVVYLVRAAFAARGWVFRRRPDGTIGARGFPATRRMIAARLRLQRAAR